MKNVATFTKGLVLFLLLGISMSSFAQDCNNPNVLILNDAQSEPEVIAFLNAAGITNVTDCCTYYDWDGITPSADDFDVIMYLDGYDYGSDLQPAAAQALIDFVNGGGTLITTEWLAYDWRGETSDPFLDILPFIDPDGDYDYAVDRNVLLPAHPLAANLPAFIPDETGFGYSFTIPHPDAVVVIETSDGYPALSYREVGAGKSIHINHDMTYTDYIDSLTGQMLVNSALYFNCTPDENDDPITPDIGPNATCDITNVIEGEQYSCDAGTGTYTQEIWVEYTMSDMETNFEILIDGQGPWIRKRATQNSPQKIKLDIPADGNDHTIFVRTESFSGCTFNAVDLFEALSCGSPVSPCDITDFTLRSSNPTPCNGDGTHDLKIKVFGPNLPATDADAYVVIGGQPQPIASYEKKPNGTVNIRVNDISENGTLDVFVQVEGGCTWTEYSFYTAPGCNTRVASDAIGSAFIYPNPTKGNFTIAGKGIKKASYKVLSLMGQVVATGTIENYQDQRIDLSRFEDGMYIISVLEGDQIRTERIVKR